jgi:hypothetical protein
VGLLLGTVVAFCGLCGPGWFGVLVPGLLVAGGLVCEMAGGVGPARLIFPDELLFKLVMGSTLAGANFACGLFAITGRYKVI